MREPDFISNTRSSYDAIARDYAAAYRGDHAAMLRSGSPGRPLDRAMLDAFVAAVREGPWPDGPVLDVGSGPGEFTALLHEAGLNISGLDLSPAMVDLAADDHPRIPFRVGTMTEPDVADASLAGLVSWYSLIHVPESARPGVLSGFRSALAPGGPLLLGFQTGSKPRRYRDAFGHAVELDFHRLNLEEVAAMVEDAGLEVTARLERAPEGREPTPQGFVLAHRPRSAPRGADHVTL